MKGMFFMNGSYDRPGNPGNPQRGRNPNSSWNNGGRNASNNNDNEVHWEYVRDINNPNRNLAESRAWVERLLREHPEFVTPPQQTFDSPEMEGSIQKILSKNIGNYVVIEFLIGTDQIHRKQGQLFHVGTSYITLYDDENVNFILCDIFSVKFVYFYVPGQRPNRNFNILPNVNGNIG